MKGWLKAGLEVVSKSWNEVAKSFECMDIGLFVFSFSSFLLLLIVFSVLGLEKLHDCLFQRNDVLVNKGRAKLFNEIVNALHCCSSNLIIIILSHHHQQARNYHCSEYLL